MQVRVNEIALDREVLQGFKDNGFVRLSGLIGPDIIRNALREVNRQIGQSQSGVDQFKAKSFPSQPEITNLFNKSGIPSLLKLLLGDKRNPYQGAGQLAIRFPGDACPPGTTETNYNHSEAVRKGWHIDGCPSNFIPGITDHYGEIHNFDCLVGVLLSTTTQENSGELCVYPKSHYDLASYFQTKANLDAVYKKGNEKLPTGVKTDQVLKNKPVHCLGNAGDVFLANYMTAHYIAPNTSENIRYAVYFRVKSSAFGHKGHCKRPMLEPWVNWKGLDGRITVRVSTRHSTVTMAMM